MKQHLERAIKEIQIIVITTKDVQLIKKLKEVLQTLSLIYQEINK